MEQLKPLSHLFIEQLSQELIEENDPSSASAQAQHVRESKIKAYREDPALYAQEILGISLTPDQEAIAKGILSSRRIVVLSHHSAGKTLLAAILARWWFDCWDQHIVYITAPSWRQCLGLTYKQILRFTMESPPLHEVEISLTGKIKNKDPYLATGHFILAINAESGEGFQGEHTAPLLQIYEEAVGVPFHIWDSGTGLMTDPQNRLIAIGNPTDEATEFGAATRSKAYKVYQMSGLKHPNVLSQLKQRAEHLIKEELAGKPLPINYTFPYPGAISLQWVDEEIERNCVALYPHDLLPILKYPTLAFNEETNPVVRRQGPPGTFEFEGRWYKPNSNFQARVLGQFPDQADEQVIPKGWIRGADKFLREEDDNDQSEDEDEYNQTLTLAQTSIEYSSSSAYTASILTAVYRSLLLTECRRPKPAFRLPEIGADIARHGADRTVIICRFYNYPIAIKIIRLYDLTQVTNAVREMADSVAEAYSAAYHALLPSPDGTGFFVSPHAIPLRIDVTGGLGAGPADALMSEGYTITYVNSASKGIDTEQYPNVRSELWFTIRERAYAGDFDLSLLPADVRRDLILELIVPRWKPNSRGQKVVENKDDIKKRLGTSPDIAEACCLSFYAEAAPDMDFSSSFSEFPLPATQVTDWKTIKRLAEKKIKEQQERELQKQLRHADNTKNISGIPFYGHSINGMRVNHTPSASDLFPRSLINPNKTRRR